MIFVECDPAFDSLRSAPEYSRLMQELHTLPGCLKPPLRLLIEGSLDDCALQAIAGSTALTDITIQATASYVAGSDEETGTATLVARGNAESLITLNLSGGQRQEIRQGIQGAWVGTDGVAHAMATHNCFIDAEWYFPALSLAALASDPTQIAVLVGQRVHAAHRCLWEVHNEKNRD